MGFNVGDIVAVQADPSRVGPVIQIMQSVDGFGRYRVFHEAGSMREYAEDQLVLVAAHQEATTAGLSPEEFRARLVAARLSHPLTDHVYSLRQHGSSTCRSSSGRSCASPAPTSRGCSSPTTSASASVRASKPA
ncbi:hypothetical protein [Micromonospora sp. CPCC 205556]|uniref:hypothetical protein n=1 Tax=Micromonospora sp. CPCC 205556 TaxID=3122398 RepID=UPI002FF27A16